MKTAFIPTVIVVAISVVAVRSAAGDHGDGKFDSNSLVLSRSVYQGTAETVTVGQTLPPGCVDGTVTLPLIAGGTTTVSVKCAKAVDNGEYPNLIDTHNVWNNDTADGSFGVTSPIYLDNLNSEGKLLGTLRI